MSDDSVRDAWQHGTTSDGEPTSALEAEIIRLRARIAWLTERIIRLQSDLDRAEGFREGVRSGEAVEGWRPIETAPKDGTPVLVARDMGAHGWVLGSAHWQDVAGFGGWVSRGLAGGTDLGLAHPTHWRPRPAQPVLHPEEGQ